MSAFLSSDRNADGLPAGRRIIGISLALALLLRLPFAFWELLHHPDELWQYLEPAHGILTGHAVVPWEYRAGIRTWLIPSMLSVPMALGKLLAPDTLHYLLPVRLALASFSLSIVGFGAAFALRISRWHGLVTGLMLATSFELVYFSDRALSDSIAPALFLPGLWLLLVDGPRPRLRALAGGALLGLCFAVRFQLAPALGVALIGGCWRDRRLWLPAIAGGLLALAVDGLVDLAHGAVPLRWIIENVRINLVERRSADYGTESWQWYLPNQIRVWGWAFVPILACAIVGARRMPLLAVVALVNVAAHSAIPHKEYRFIFLSVVLALVLAGIGAADVASWVARRRNVARPALLTGLMLIWVAASVAVATSPGRRTWSSNKRIITLMRAAHNVPNGCGLAFLQPPGALVAAYTYYDRATPIYVFNQDDSYRAASQLGSAFNMAVTSPDRAHLLGTQYRLVRCVAGRKDRRGSRLERLPQSCLFVRPGGCGAPLDPRYGINAALARRGE
ncbi:hypothetical protein Q4F19_19910 [Sphingomonas sp. BIUV-7]|uniref:Alg9-like mannosyltransferase family protein n=1 Tax=Sphingomonas natans TaxID=3063330 RepID=A0ABT8YE63_9SPHN|nr:hypothetical protein [Sphingomonas sp. BIUV-7]MDO6416660.1 hypothetical protein [Sphingomonas sp. BIUV-7]